LLVQCDPTPSNRPKINTCKFYKSVAIEAHFRDLSISDLTAELIIAAWTPVLMDQAVS
jgi:hypothetical protein